jgi:porin
VAGVVGEAAAGPQDSRIGPAARAFDRDTILFGQGTGPIRSSEVVIEARLQRDREVL